MIIRASIANDKARGWVFSMNITNANATDADGAEVSLASLVYDLAPAASAPTILTLNTVSAGFSFRDAQRRVAIDTLESSISLSHTDFIAGPNPDETWRNAGGAIEIHGLNATTNEAKLSVSGSVSLDGDNRPEGALTAVLEKTRRPRPCAGGKRRRRRRRGRRRYGWSGARRHGPGWTH